MDLEDAIVHVHVVEVPGRDEADVAQRRIRAVGGDLSALPSQHAVRGFQRAGARRQSRKTQLRGGPGPLRPGQQCAHARVGGSRPAREAPTQS